jgi:hypothetical protein
MSVELYSPDGHTLNQELALELLKAGMYERFDIVHRKVEGDDRRHLGRPSNDSQKGETARNALKGWERLRVGDIARQINQTIANQESTEFVRDGLPRVPRQ